MVLEPRRDEKVSVFLPPRSLFKLERESRFWTHSIAECKTDVDPATGLEVVRGTRYSLVFRKRILK
jgi:hypothetical protein